MKVTQCENNITFTMSDISKEFHYHCINSIHQVCNEVCMFIIIITITITTTTTTRTTTTTTTTTTITITASNPSVLPQNQ